MGSNGVNVTFRQKILVSYLLVFLIFIILLFPVIFHLIKKIEEGNLRAQTSALIQKINTSNRIDKVVENLKKEENYIFFRVTLLDQHGKVLFDTYSHEEVDDYELLSEHPEIAHAIKKGYGYLIQYSAPFGQELAYTALPFFVSDKQYVLRTAFPYGQINSVSDEFAITFIALTTAILLLFGLMTWLIINYLTSPVAQIIRAIKPYQEGRTEHIPEIKLKGEDGSKNEFSILAQTLNSLTRRIEQQISHLSQERNDKAAILESLGEGVVAVDGAMTVVYINRVAENFLHIEKGLLVGKSFIHARQPKCHSMLHDAQFKKDVITDTLKTIGKPKRYLDLIAVPRQEKQGAILVLQDKTSLHKVLELGRDFIANASHELKTPITIIRGFAETLHDHPELSREVSSEITEKIVSNCQRMDTLVKNLLTLADIDEGLPRSRLQECDVNELIQSCKQMVLAVHPKADISIDHPVSDPIYMMLDPDLFELAIMNLLDNAVKYSSSPANVKVSLERHDNQVVIKVTDKGIGIPQEDVEHIFQRFYTVNKAHSRSLGGSGLGLSIVERIIEKHQGKIVVESILGQGTTFTIHLPVLDESY